MKKQLFIPLFAMAAIVACNKEDEATPQVAQEKCFMFETYKNHSYE